MTEVILLSWKLDQKSSIMYT